MGRGPAQSKSPATVAANTTSNATATSAAVTTRITAGSFLVTRLYLTLCIAITALVQAQRLTPAAISMPSSLAEAAAEPWRLLGAFCYGDGLTLSFALRVQAIACASYTLEHVCCCQYTAAAERSPLPLSGSLLYAACMAIGIGLLAAAGLARPAEGAAFQLGAVALFLLYVASSLPPATLIALGGAPFVPFGNLLPYMVALGVAVVYGAGAALQLCVGIGVGVLFECLDLLPSPLPESASTSVSASSSAAAAAPPPSSEPAVETTAAWPAPTAIAKGGIAAPKMALGPRAALIALLLCGSMLAHYGQWEAPPPPLPASLVMSTHGRVLFAATSFGSPANHAETAYISSLVAATNLTASPAARKLGPMELLKLYQHVADTWHAKLRDIMSPPSVGNLRAKGGGGAGGAEVMQVTEEEATEMERLLSDALSRTDFASTLSDRDVLKAIIRTLTPQQASTMARMPRERLLSTVAAHRESHRVAHEALARLGTVLQELQKTHLEGLTGQVPPTATTLEAEGAEKVAEQPTGEAVDAESQVADEAEAGSETAATASSADAESDGIDVVGEAEAEGGEGGAGGAGGAAVEGAEAGEAATPLVTRLAVVLNETLSAFAIPLDMEDSDVVHELLAGTATERTMPRAHKAFLTQQVHETRALILERFFNLSVAELRGLLLVQPPKQGGGAGGGDRKSVV